jgi:V8-like Glu-specific endopeptidase
MGSLIAPNLVLTAAHNVYSKNTNSQAEFLTFIPGIVDINSLFGISVRRSNV